MKIWKITTVQMYARAHSWPRLANLSHPRLSARERWVQSLLSSNILHANFFTFILLISNHTVFLVQFGINLHLWVFQKAKLHSLKRLVQFQLFEKLTRANEWLPIHIGKGLSDNSQKLQNRAARILTFSNYETRSSILLDELGWESLENKILKQLVTTYV